MTMMLQRDFGSAVQAMGRSELPFLEWWTRVWWEWDAGTQDWFSIGYHWFNLLEAVIWFGIAAMVGVKNYREHRTAVDWLYALAFLVFGLTDMVEARQQSSPLILFKLMNLIELVCLRQIVSRRQKSATN